MITLFRPMRERSNLEERWVFHAFSQNLILAQCRKSGLFQTLRSILVSVVDDNILFCRASDGVVMLEQANRPSGIYQQTII